MDFATSADPAVQAQLDRLAALTLPQGRFGLETISVMLDRLGNPQDRIPPTFHVAGTNGKGSTCAYLRAMLEAQGYIVHTATKPHLVRYNERIRLAGKLIDDMLLASLLKEVLDSGSDLSPSFFEVTTAATFLAFARIPAQACVIEVGLGGRFDATNVLKQPAVCGIAALGIDHEAFLLREEMGTPSNPLARIAFEKASIARPGRPLVTMAYPPEATQQIVRIARKLQAPVAMRGLEWQAHADDMIRYEDAAGTLDLPLPTMCGAHQADNAALAVAMLRHQTMLPVSAEAMAAGIRAASWPARLQALGPGPLTALLPDAKLLLDGGHNPNAGQAIADYLAQSGRPAIAVLGMLANKDAKAFIEPLAPHLAVLYAVPVSGHEHHPPLELAGMAKAAGVPVAHTASDVRSALRRIGEDARAGEALDGTVLISGSLYLAGQVLEANDEIPQ